MADAKSVLITKSSTNKTRRFSTISSAAKAMKISGAYLSNMLRTNGGSVTYNDSKIEFVSPSSSIRRAPASAEDSRHDPLFTATLFAGGLVVIEPKPFISKFLDKAVSFASVDEIPYELRKLTEGL